MDIIVPSTHNLLKQQKPDGRNINNVWLFYIPKFNINNVILLLHPPVNKIKHVLQQQMDYFEENKY